MAWTGIRVPFVFVSRCYVLTFSSMKWFQPKLAKTLGAITAAVLLSGLFFRFAIYRHMYIGPNDAYGVSDTIELLLDLGLEVVLSVSASVCRWPWLSALANLPHSIR